MNKQVFLTIDKGPSLRVMEILLVYTFKVFR
jgi:hypothetical protein